MAYFKVGDKVKGRERGKLYTVVEVSGGAAQWLSLECALNGSVFHNQPASSFVLAEDTSKHRPHHDIIVAWAKGAEVEIYNPTVGRWEPREEPLFTKSCEYRIVDVAALEAELDALTQEQNLKEQNRKILSDEIQELSQRRAKLIKQIEENE